MPRAAIFAAVLAAAATFVFTATAAHAAIIEYAFTGIVTTIYAQEPEPVQHVTVGMTFSGTFAYDTSVEPTSTLDTSWVAEQNVVIAIAYDGTPLPFEGTGTPSGGFYLINDDAHGYGFDLWMSGQTDHSTPGQKIAPYLLVWFRDWAATPTDSLDYPTHIALDDFDAAEFWLRGDWDAPVSVDGFVDIRGTITSLTLIPEPTTAALLLIAAACCVGRRR